MHTWATSSWLMLHLGLQPAAPVFERAAVVVDASAFLDADVSLEPFLEDALGAKLWTLGVRARRDPADPVLWVRVRPTEAGYTFALRVGATPDAPERKRGVCAPCTREQLSTRLESLVVEVARSARVPPDAAAVAEAFRPPESVPRPAPAPSVRPPREPSTAPSIEPRTLRRAGLAVLVSGAGVAACGAILVAAGDIRVSPNYAAEYTTVEYGNVGYGVLAAGVAAAVVGSILVGLEARRARRPTHRAALRGMGLRF